MYLVAEGAVLSLANFAAVSDTAAASAALAVAACDGMAIPRSSAANVLSVAATLRSTPSTQQDHELARRRGQHEPPGQPARRSRGRCAVAGLGVLRLRA